MDASREYRISRIISKYKLANKREWTALLATIFSLLNKLVSLLAIFFYVRWTIPYLGQERFGVWMAMSSIIAFIAVFSDLGLGSSLVNYIAATKLKEERSTLKEYISSAFFFLLIMSCSLGLILFGLNNQILLLIGNGLQNADYISEVRLSIFLLFSFFLIGLPFIIIDKTLEGLQLTYISSIWAGVGNILSLLITYIFTQYSLPIYWLIVSTIGVQSIFRIFYFFLEFQGRLKGFGPSFTKYNVDTLVKLLKHGLLFFILNLFYVLAFQVDNLIITKELGVKNVPVFSLMQKLITISLFFWFYTISLWPAFAEAHSNNDKVWIKKTTRFVALLNTSFGLLFGLVIIFFSSTILFYWSKGEVGSPSFQMKLGFALFVVVNGLISTAGMVFNTGPLVKKHALEFCLASFVTICCKMFFVKKFGVDYLMYLSILPFVLLYLLPCFLKYRKYVQSQ